MAFKARYEGTCRRCGDSIDVGDRIESNSGRGYRHVSCSGQPARSGRSRAQRRMDAEYAAGVADVQRWRAEVALFGDEYAAREEMARMYMEGW